jgi:hypothetical protein
MNENSQGFEPEQSTKRKNEGFPKREDYEDEERWRWEVVDYFAGKKVVTREEFETYMKARYPDEFDRAGRKIAEEDFEIEGCPYSAIVIQVVQDWEGASPPPTRIFIVKDK